MLNKLKTWVISPYGVFCLLLAITLYRLVFLSLETLNLYGDEAQYWTWSTAPAFGYFSKPPMIGWMIWFTTSLCGDTPFCIRLSSPLLHFLTSLVVYALSMELFKDRATAALSAVTYATLPAVILSSTLISTDPLLLFFWGSSLYAFIRADKTGEWHWWIITGFLAGFGLLSKYNMVFFAPSVALNFFFRDRSLKALFSLKLWIAGLISLAVFSPNLLWNVGNHFVTFAHTKDISDIGKRWFHPDHFLIFIAGQAAIMGLIPAWITLKACFRQNELPPFAKHILVAFLIPLFAFIALLSLLTHAEANWAAPIYISATLLATGYAGPHPVLRKWLYGSIILHLLLSLGFTHYHAITDALNIERLSHTKRFWQRDPFYRLYGWDTLGTEITRLRVAYPNAKLMTDERKILAELVYYVRPHAFDIRKWSHGTDIHDHYDLVSRLKGSEKGGNFLFITRNINDRLPIILKHFAQHTQVEVLTIPTTQDASMRFHVYYLEGFLGFGPGETLLFKEDPVKTTD